MKKKKGFTLVEIIVVIGLLSIVAVIFAVNMTGILSKNKDNENTEVTNEIISAAKSYVAMNPDKLKEVKQEKGYIIVTVGELRDSGLLPESLKYADTKSVIPDEEYVRISVDNDGNTNVSFLPIDGSINEDVYDTFVGEDIKVPYDKDGTVSAWCVEDNIYQGNGETLYLERHTFDNDTIAVNKYEFKVKDTDPSEYPIKYVSCNVNPSIPGTYQIIYSYYNPHLSAINNNEATYIEAVRYVQVESDKTDIASFKAEFKEDNKFTVKQSNNIFIEITETELSKETNKILLLVKDSVSLDEKSLYYYADLSQQNSSGYTIKNFSTTEATGSAGRVATITFNKRNSSGVQPSNVTYDLVYYVEATEPVASPDPQCKCTCTTATCIECSKSQNECINQIEEKIPHCDKSNTNECIGYPNPDEIQSKPNPDPTPRVETIVNPRTCNVASTVFNGYGLNAKNIIFYGGKENVASYVIYKEKLFRKFSSYEINGSKYYNLIYAGNDITGRYGQLGYCVYESCCNSGRYTYSYIGDTSHLDYNGGTHGITKVMDNYLDDFYNSLGKTASFTTSDRFGINGLSSSGKTKNVRLLTMQEYNLAANCSSTYSNSYLLSDTDSFWLNERHSVDQGAQNYNYGQKESYSYNKYVNKANGSISYGGMHHKNIIGVYVSRPDMTIPQSGVQDFYLEFNEIMYPQYSYYYNSYGPSENVWEINEYKIRPVIRLVNPKIVGDGIGTKANPYIFE